jgi:hypothetical protein
MPHELDSLVESGVYTLHETLWDIGIEITDAEFDQLCTVVANMIKEAKK